MEDFSDEEAGDQFEDDLKKAIQNSLNDISSNPGSKEGYNDNNESDDLLLQTLRQSEIDFEKTKKKENLGNI